MNNLARISTFACIAFVCLLATVAAHDISAVAKRLKKAVKKGEINQHQADVMLQAYVNTLPKKEVLVDHERQEHIERIAAGLKSAVAIGLMSEEEALRTYQEIKQGRRDAFHDEEIEIEIEIDDRDLEAELQAAREDLVRAVEEGELSKEEAEERFESLVQEFRRRREHARDHEREEEEELIKARERLRRAIEQGKINEEQAEKEFIELEREIDRRHRDRERVDEVREREEANEKYRQAAEAIERAFKNGDLTEEQVREKWEAIKRELQQRER